MAYQNVIFIVVKYETGWGGVDEYGRFRNN